MSKVVFLNIPAHGHTNPTLGLVREIVNRGEEVVYFSDEEFRQKIENTGARVESYGFMKYDRDSENQQIVAENRRKELGLYHLNFQFLNSLHMTRNVIDNIINRVRDEKPDYVIYDSIAYWGKLIARELKVPAVCSMTMFVYCDRVFDTDPEFVIKEILRLKDRYLTDVHKTRREIDKLCELGKLYGIDGVNYLDMMSPVEKLNIVYTSREFQPKVECFGENFKFVGPSIIERNETVDFPFEKLNDRPLIYISMGTRQMDNDISYYENYYKTFFEAFGNIDKQVVLSLGDVIGIEALGEVPENFIVREYVPQLEILKRANLFITHAGMNSTNEGLYFDVPLIVFPQVHDQFLVATRVEQVGCGICIYDTNISADELREYAEKVLSNASFLSNAKRIGESLRAAGGFVRAADEIFRFKELNGIA